MADGRQEDPGRACLAVCGGPPAPWPRGGLRRPVGRVRPLPPAEGQRRAHGERDGRARHAGDGRRRSRREVATVRSPTTTTQSFREDFRRLGLSYDLFSRTTTLNHERVVQDLFRTLYEHGAIIEREMLVSFSPATGPHAPRPLHRGHLPDLRVPGGARRPVRQLRQPARPDRPDQPALAGSTARSRSSARRSTSSSTCRSSPTASASWIEAHDDWRPNVQQLLARRCSTRSGRGRSPATSTGASASRSPATPRIRHKRIYVWFDAVIGYLSASIEWAAATRRPGRLARVVAEPRGGALLLPGQGQHRLPHRHLAGDAARLRRRAASTAPAAAPLELPDNVVATEFLTTGRASSSRPAAATRSSSATSSTATTPTRSATTSSRRPGDAGHRLHLGRVRPPQQRRAARELGQPRQPDADERPPQLRRGPRARAS